MRIKRLKRRLPTLDEMNITGKLITDAVGELLGEEFVEVVQFLRGKNKVSEFMVAKELKKDIHEARSLLYKLYENNLAIFERKKDRQKGWYVTYWDFFPDNIPHLYRKILKERLEKLKERLKKEQASEFYMCRKACARMDFDRAVNLNFKCPECGEIINPVDNKRTIEFISEKIKDMEKAMADA